MKIQLSRRRQIIEISSRTYTKESTKNLLKNLPNAFTISSGLSAIVSFGSLTVPGIPEHLFLLSMKFHKLVGSLVTLFSTFAKNLS